MRTLKSKFKKIVSTTTIVSLIQTPTVVFAQGQAGSQNNPTKRATQVMETVTTGLNMYSKFLQTNNEQKIQQLQNQQLQKQLASLAPTVVPSKVFPECAITPSMSNSVKDFCYVEPSINAINANNQMKQLADGWVNTLNKVLNTASNGQTEIGILCLNNRQKSLDDNFQELLNNLTRLSEQLNTEKEGFKKLNAALLDQMKTIKSELSGGTEGTNLDTKTKDYTALFSKDCQTLIANKTANLAKAGGLLGISGSLAASKSLANTHNQNKTSIEKEMRRDAQNAADLIKKHGLAGLSMRSPTQFKSLEGAMGIEASKFQVNYERIKKELSALEYELPPLDKNFTVDLNDFTSQAKDFFKKRYINQCVTGEDKTGVALSTSQVLGALKQRSTNNKGTAAAQYKVALENIMNSDTFIQDKVNQIKALEQSYKDISVTYRGSNGQSVTSSPYDLYIKQINLCEQQYASSNAATSSEKKKVNRGVGLLNELQGINNNFISNFINNSIDASLNCSGNSAKNGLNANSCEKGEVYDYAHPNYCLANASSCANTIIGCDAELTNQITIRKNKQKTLAATYNTNMQNMITKANALVKAQNTAVLAMMKKIQAKFPGTNIEVPSDLLIVTPELSSKAFDVALIGNGDLRVMDDVNNKIDLLKEAITQQREKTGNEIKTYIASQEDAAKREMAKWDELSRTCAANEQDSKAQLAQMNQEGMQRQAEEDGKVGAFCRKYGALRNNPMAGCGGSLEKLMTDYDAVAASGRLAKSVDYSLGEYSNLCAQFNNESESKINKLEQQKDEACDGDKPNTSLCNAYKRQLAAEMNKSSNNKSSNNGSSSSSASISKLCGDRENPRKNNELIAQLSKFAAEENRSNLKKITTLSKFKKELNDEDSNVADFFDIIEDELKIKTMDEGFCANIYKKLYKEKPATNPQLATATQTNATTEPFPGQAVDPEAPVADPAKKENVANNDNNNKSSQEQDEMVAEVKDNINTALEKLTGYVPIEEKKRLAYYRIGEQTTNDCDSQLSTTASTNKGTDFLKAFDASILGSSKAK